jgi:transposase
MANAPWIVSDGLWKRVEPLLPTVERRFRFPRRKRLSDRQALQGILFVLHTGIAWRHLPLELGFGSGSTCYRRLDEALALILIRVLSLSRAARRVAP